jgi:class 3 adenylate cyclase
MAQFSRDILVATRQVVNELQTVIGEETASSLSLRVGIHSGSVTAGVLRGRKSRFQLFGETAAIANKMESLGKMNRVHVSEAAAHHIKSAHKEHWLIRREDTGGYGPSYWLTEVLDEKIVSKPGEYSGGDAFDDDDASVTCIQHEVNPFAQVDEDVDYAIKQMLQHLDKNVPNSDKPLAKLYKNCTICFCDVQGFASWASKRDPNRVFKLLENTFRAFDSIAKRRGVFKVETVGDCFLACTGIPVETANHALSMARFSREVVAAFHQVIHEIGLKLGEDTVDLGLRCGLHSGEYLIVHLRP